MSTGSGGSREGFFATRALRKIPDMAWSAIVVGTALILAVLDAVAYGDTVSSDEWHDDGHRAATSREEKR